MQAFDALTSPGQVRRLARLARVALEEYDLPAAELRPIAHWENTTFRVDASAGGDDGHNYEPGRFLLRVHSVGYQTPARIASEMAWLGALREEAGLIVPEPVLSRRGEAVVVAEAAGVPQPRACSLLRWVRGRFCKSPSPSYYEALGELMAKLHNHSAGWKPPVGFERRRWDWDGFFGSGVGLGHGGGSREVWSLVPQPYRATFERVAEHARAVMDGLGHEPDAWGLIHADLHPNNVLLRASQARAIDFDDCGWGHWAYDMAVVLGRHLLDESPEAVAQRLSLERGYARHRPLPHSQMAHLKSLSAARGVALALWVLSRSRDNPTFRERLPARLERVDRDCKLLLGLS